MKRVKELFYFCIIGLFLVQPISAQIDAKQEIKKNPDRAEIIISHQERILSVADRIIVIENGCVKSEGIRDEVLPTIISSSHCPACPKPVVKGVSHAEHN